MGYLIVLLFLAMCGTLAAIIVIVISEYQSRRGYLSEWAVALIVALTVVSLLLAGQIGVLSATTATVRGMLQPGVEFYEGGNPLEETQITGVKQ